MSTDTTPAALDIDRIRAAVEASKPPGWARGEFAWRRDTVALLAEVERLHAELAPYRPPLSGKHPHPTYDQIVKAWQDTLDQQDEWRRAMKEMGAEMESHSCTIARIQALHVRKVFKLEGGKDWASNQCAACQYEYPCPTLLAIDEAVNP
jgi:hypothetical protein